MFKPLFPKSVQEKLRFEQVRPCFGGPMVTELDDKIGFTWLWSFCMPRLLPSYPFQSMLLAGHFIQVTCIWSPPAHGFELLVRCLKKHHVAHFTSPWAHRDHCVTWPT